MRKADQSQTSFVKYLMGLTQREDRAALAALRRGVGRPPGAAPEMYPLVVPWTSHMYSSEADNYYLIAALFALHPCNCTEGNMGTTLKALSQPGDSIEKRFVALLNAHSDDLPSHLRHAVSLARSKEITINWARLLTDLAYWGLPDRFVQRQWATEFWKRESAGASESAEASGN